MDRGARRRGWKLWARRLAPWVITAAIVVGLLYQYSLSEIITELEERAWGPLLPWALGCALATLCIVAGCDLLVMRTTLGGLRYRDTFAGKGASSLFALLGYGFAHAAYGVWIARRAGANVRTTFGVILYIMLSDLAAVCVIASAAIWLGGVELRGFSTGTIGVVAGCVAAGLVLAGLLGGRILRGVIRDAHMLRPWLAISPLVYVANVAGRCCLISVGVVATWAASDAFGLGVPFWAMAGILPIIMLIGSLPINVAGFGAVQAAWLAFEPWADGEHILAFQFLWHLFIGLGLVLRGLPFARRVLREIEHGPGRGASDQIVGQAS